jgi:hypothetical protein
MIPKVILKEPIQKMTPLKNFQVFMGYFFPDVIMPDVFTSGSR